MTNECMIKADRLKWLEEQYGEISIEMYLVYLVVVSKGENSIDSMIDDIKSVLLDESFECSCFVFEEYINKECLSCKELSRSVGSEYCGRCINNGNY